MKVSNQPRNGSCPSEYVLMIAIASVLAIISMASGSAALGSETPQTYIVYVQDLEAEIRPLSLDDRRKWYASFLARSRVATPENEGSSEPSVMYAYEHVMTGFAAKLTKAQVEAMAKLPGFVDAVPDGVMSLDTTYSSQFLGLHPRKGTWPQSNFGKGVIIGMLDSGVWPESHSFKDEGMPPVPPRWKGTCQTVADWNSSSCNNKIIGARVFNSGAMEIGLSLEDTPRDQAGHGTHTASIAAGNSVGDADIFGYANGTAGGVAPLAHLAIYKVCFGRLFGARCAFSDVLSGIDAAISDGVDVISMSIGSGQQGNMPLYDKEFAIAALRAIEKGIFVSCSAGNSGPALSMVGNDAPWIMTVGASTMDRDFAVSAKLGDGNIVSGQSFNPPATAKGRTTEQMPLVLEEGNDFCSNGSLDPSRIRGKLVVCSVNEGEDAVDLVQKGTAVREAGGAGLILANVFALDAAAEAHVLPASHVGFKDGEAIRVYINSTKAPTATIYSEGTIFGAGKNANAPRVASFSSRGPSLSCPGILKPDVIAPGVAILAAWPADVSPSRLPDDPRRVKFNTMSGTSMACPHVSGIAALLKSLHPDWSPAAIKSALMTTADILNKRGDPILDAATAYPANVFAMGAGHVNVEKAADPGLIYDITPQDYIAYLCGLSFNSLQMGKIVNKTVACPPSSDETSLPENLNYPSFALNVPALPFSATFKRTVTNVGPANSTYSVDIVAPDGVNVTVIPSSLSFSALKEKKSYSLTFAAVKLNPSNSFTEGSITWILSSSVHRVRSPISVWWTAN